MKKVTIRALRLLDPRIETEGFKDNLLRVLKKCASDQYHKKTTNHSSLSGDLSLDEYLGSLYSVFLLMNKFNVLPDAFVIDEEKRQVLFYKIDGKKELTAQNSWDIIDLAESITFELGLDVKVFLSDRFANLTLLDTRLLQEAMIHEIEELQAKNELMNERVELEWPPRAFMIKYTCRKCGQEIKGQGLYRHRLECKGIKKT